MIGECERHRRHRGAWRGRAQDSPRGTTLHCAGRPPLGSAKRGTGSPEGVARGSLQLSVSLSRIAAIKSGARCRARPSFPGSLRPLASLYSRSLAQALELPQARDLIFRRAQLALKLFIRRVHLALELPLSCADLELDFPPRLAQLALAPPLELRAGHRPVRVQPRAKRRHVRLHLRNQLFLLLRHSGAQGLPELVEHRLRNDDVSHRSSPREIARTARAARAAALLSRRT